MESSGEFLRRLGTDAEKWAYEFQVRFPEECTVKGDELTAWFANAIEAGRSAAPARALTDPLTLDLNGANLTYDAIRRFRRNLHLQFWPHDSGEFAMTSKMWKTSIEPLYNDAHSLSVDGFLTGGKTLAGISVVELEDIPEGEIHFRDPEGRLLGKIVHIGRV